MLLNTSPSARKQIPRRGLVESLRAKADGAAEYGGFATPFRLAAGGPGRLSVPKALSSSWGVGDKPTQRLLPPVESSMSDRVKPNCAPHVTYVTVVFDLDETLVNNRRLGRAILRPGAVEVLRSLRELSNDKLYVEIILWTASMESVAKPAVQRLDPTATVFDYCIYRDRRWYKETGYTKDLRRLGRDMKRTVIVENSPLSVELNRRNAILVKDFVGGPNAVNDSQLDTVKLVLSEWIEQVKRAIDTDPITPAAPDAAVSTLTPRIATTAMKEAATDASPFPHFGPPIAEFLAKHPHVSAGNEIIVSYPKGATTGGITGGLSLRSSMPVPRDIGLGAEFGIPTARRSASLASAQRSIPKYALRGPSAYR